MSCTEIERRLDDYVDGELSEENKRLVEEHLKTCLPCNRALTELRSLVERSRGLPTEIEPDRALWPGIESRLATGPTGARGARRSALGDSRWQSLSWNTLAAAAVLLLAVAVPLTLWQLGRDRLGERRGPAEAPVASMGETRSESPSMAVSDGRSNRTQVSSQRTAVATTAILARKEDGTLLPRTDLLETVERHRGILSLETLTTIEESARLIDQAIAETRTALNESPGDRQLELLLAARYQQEVALLKRVSKV